MNRPVDRQSLQKSTESSSANAPNSTPTGKPMDGAALIRECRRVLMRGFVLAGVHELDHSGFSVSGAGDVNGDGIDDFLIGAPHTYNRGYYYARTGESYVVFGRSAAR